MIWKPFSPWLTNKCKTRRSLRLRVEALEQRILLSQDFPPFGHIPPQPPSDLLGAPPAAHLQAHAEHRSGFASTLSGQVQGLYRTLLHQAPTPVQLRQALRFLRSGTLQQFEAQLLGSSFYFRKRAHRNSARFLTVLAQDVLGHPLDAAHLQQYSAMLKHGTSRTTVALLVLQQRGGVPILPPHTPPPITLPPITPPPVPGPTTVTLTEGNGLLTQATVPVTLGPAGGTRTLRIPISAHFDPTAPGAAIGDQLLVYLVDANHPNQTLLDRGQPGTALFTLTGAGADYLPGLVHYDGSTLTVDVTSLTTATKGLLLFQLVGMDSATGTMVTAGPVADTVNPGFADDTAFPHASQTVAAGPALNLSGLSPAADLHLLVGNVRYDTSANLYTAELRVRDDGAATGRQVAVVFPGLPAGVQLQNPSGTDASGQPYLNFTGAIPDGGLGIGTESNPVQVVFADPRQLRFSLVPQILSGGPDHAPVFTPVGPLNVKPGGYLQVALQATDPDGDPVHFSLPSSGPLPTGNLQSDGTLVFTPTPAEVGTYHLTLVASDGALQTTQNVTLTVAADTVTATRLSGVVQVAAGHPLVGVPVDIQGTSATATTGSDGSFLLDLGSGTISPSVVVEVHGEQLGGPTVYSFVAASQAVLLGHDLYGGVNNVIGQPILLTAVDTAHEVTINPSQATTMSTAALPGASLQLAAGAVLDASGTHPYSGPLGLTEVPLDSLPVPLPAGFHPDLAVLIAPGNLRFSDFSAALTLPNRGSWPAGTSFELWSLDPFSGQFRDVTSGHLSADGTTIASAGTLPSSGLYFFVRQAQAATSLSADPLNPVPGLPGRKASAHFGSDVDLYSGTVHTHHDLVTYQSQGVERGLHLEYSSLWADPRPIIHFGFQNLPPMTSNDRLAAQLTLTPGRQVGVLEAGSGTVSQGGSGATAELGLPSGENYWLLPANGGPVEAALQADLTSQPSGVYDFTLSAGLIRYVPSLGRFAGRLGSESMPVVSVNAINSSFGSGWSLAGWQQVVTNADGSVLLIDGDGTTLLFQPPTATGGPYVSPAGDFSTLAKRADGTFQRTLKDQTVYRFNAQGQLASVTDRHGNQTQYLYDANGGLATIQDPVGLQTTFHYTGSLVTSITDPAQRTTVLQYNGDGNLTGIIDPDLSERHWDYDDSHQMTAEIDKRNNRDEDSYDFAGRANHSFRADGSTVDVAPAEVQGLFPADQTVDPFSPTLPTAVAPADAVVQIADPNGHVTTQTLDQRGQVLSTSDEVGSLGSVTRDANGMIAQSTNGLGNQTMYTYDAHGNLIGSQDSLSGPFQPQSDHFVGFANSGPEIAGTAIGDVNGDGAPDLVVVTGTGTGQVLLNHMNAAGKPTGTFTISRFLSLGSRVSSMALGDVNGDGKLDLVTSGESGVGVQVGNGNGTFTDPAFYPMGSDPGALVVADFTGDGRADVATADFMDSTVSVRLANPDGTLGPVTTYDVGASQGALAAADINSDGVPDLVTLSRDGTSLTVLLGNKNPATGKGDGTFTVGTPIPIQSPGANSIAFGDLNEDGHLDIVLQGEVLLGHGDGAFTVVAHPEIKGNPAVADVDGDHHLDVLFQSSTSTMQSATASTTVLRGKGDGTFGQQLTTPLSVAGIIPFFQPQVSDLNGDGRPDLIVNISPYMGALDAAVLLNNGLYAAGSGHLGQRTYTYDPTFNERTSESDELGRQKLYQIDPANGNVLSVTVVVAGGTHNLVTSYTYFPDGQVKTITDPLGRVSAFTYDAFGRLQTQTVAQGTADQAVTTYEYDAAGNVSAIIDPDMHRTEDHYDSMNRLMRTRDALGHDTVFTYDVSGNPQTKTDARGNVTTNTYDPFGRLIQVTSPDPDGPGPLSSPVTTYTYDPAGNLIQKVDPLQHVTQYGYDARKRLTSITDTLGGLTLYGYDLDNNRISITDPDGNRTQFAYDLRDRLVSETDLLGHANDLQYDPVNHVVSATDRDGRVVTLTYNELDRPLTETWTGVGGTADNLIHRGYDDDGNLLTITDSFSALTYTYTNRNDVSTMDNGGTPNAPHVVLAYSYDPADNVLSLTDTINGHADATNTYTPDALNRLAEVTQSGAGVSTKGVDLTYNEVGQPATIHRFVDLGGTQEVASSAYTYDNLNRLTLLVHSHGGAAVASYQYTFDAASRITQIVSNDGTTDYTLDALGQLLTADHHSSSNPAESYTYDHNGNRATSGTQASTYTIVSANRLSSDGTYTYAYDNEGNLIQRTEIATNKVRLFQWDERNRLTAVIDRDATGTVIQQVLFTYDAFDRRIAKEVKQGGSDVVTYFVQDRGNPLLDFVDDDGPSGPHAPTLAMRYLTGPAVDQVFAQEDASGRVSWLLADHLGTVRDLVDNSGTVVNHITYDSYGNVLAQTHPEIATRFLFTGREFDPETGLYYYRARYYDPKAGRFISMDPIRFRAGANLYRYVGNAPHLFTDPQGKAPPPPGFFEAVTKIWDAPYEVATKLTDLAAEQLEVTINEVNTLVSGEGGLAGAAKTEANALANALESKAATVVDTAASEATTVVDAVASEAATVVDAAASEAVTVVEGVATEAIGAAEAAAAEAATEVTAAGAATLEAGEIIAGGATAALGLVLGGILTAATENDTIPAKEDFTPVAPDPAAAAQDDASSAAGDGE
jgi:RHS repeat-associated protein